MSTHSQAHPCRRCVWPLRFCRVKSGYEYRNQIIKMNVGSRDPWLDPWLKEIEQRSSGSAVLELGCGRGRDTQILTERGISVVAIDQSTCALAEAALRVSDCQFLNQDIRAPLPVGSTPYPVIIASLCLHYFNWLETQKIVAQIRSVLEDSGLLICRLNSLNDLNYGASGNPQIEPNFYRVGANTKRFFDSESILNLFGAGWEVKSMMEQTINRYEKPKVVWEVSVLKSAMVSSPVTHA